MPDAQVVPSDYGWAIDEVPGHDAPDPTHGSHGEAVAHGREVAEQQRGQLGDPRQDGRMREKDFHGRDPRTIPA
jgi:Uncharacterized protein conserved in bacteria (DUF2188)